MKKKLLFVGCSLIASIGFSQLNSSQDGFLLDYTDASSVCLLYNTPNNGGIMAQGPTFTNSASVQSLFNSTEGLTLVSSQEIPAGSHATWYSLPHVVGTGASSQCSSLYNENLGVDMFNNSKVQIEISSDIDNAEIEFFLGSEGQWFPVTSTFNVGDASGSWIEAKILLPKANQVYTQTLDFSTLAPNIWYAWTGNNKIQSVGFRSKTPGATFNIYKIAIGKESVCPYISPQTYVNSYRYTGDYITSNINLNEGDTVKFVAGKQYSQVNTNFAVPTQASFEWQYLDNTSSSWKSVSGLPGIQVNYNEMKIDSFYNRYANSGIFKTEYRYIANYDTSIGQNSCPSILDTIYLGKLVLNCKSVTTADTTTFIVTDAQFQSVQYEMYLKGANTVSLGGCDSTHYSYYRYKYGTSANDTCNVTNVITVHDTIVHTMCDSAVVTTYDTTTVTVTNLVKVTDTLEIYLSSVLSTVFDASSAATTVRVYPNPTAKNLTVEIDNPSNLNGVSVQILNSTGTTVHQQLITSSTQSIDVSSWSAGIYFLHVMNGTTTVDVRKIVVNN